MALHYRLRRVHSFLLFFQHCFCLVRDFEEGDSDKLFGNDMLNVNIALA